MRKIDTYSEPVKKTKSNIYQTEEGLRIVESINKYTKDFDICFIVNAGAYYEDQLQIPHGTAHLFEHLPYGNPNLVFPTKESIREYRMGSKKRPSFFSNATTSHKFQHFFSHGHEKAKERMLKYTISQILFPEENIAKFIDKERGIVIEEKNRRPNDENWNWLQYMKKVFRGEFPEFERDVLGDNETIEKIGVEDLIKLYKSTFTVDNGILAIQTSKPLNKNDWKMIKQISKDLYSRNGKTIVVRKDRSFEPKLAIHHFHDKDSREVYLSFDYFYDNNYKLVSEEDYLFNRKYLFMTDLIEKVSYDYIREDHQLTYDIHTFSGNEYLFHTANRGFSLTSSFSKLDRVLEQVYNMIEVQFEKFLFSKEGDKWFNNILSYYIYPTNMNIDPNYAENIAADILENKFDKFDFQIAKKAARSLTQQSLLDFTKEFFKIEPIIWIESSHTEEEIIPIIQESKFYKKYLR